MNDVNFEGTKTSLFLSYSSLEIFDPIGLARYKFPESESCHLVIKKSSCVGFLVRVLDMNRARKYSRAK